MHRVDGVRGHMNFFNRNPLAANIFFHLLRYGDDGIRLLKQHLLDPLCERLHMERSIPFLLNRKWCVDLEDIRHFEGFRGGNPGKIPEGIPLIYKVDRLCLMNGLNLVMKRPIRD